MHGSTAMKARRLGTVGLSTLMMSLAPAIALASVASRVMDRHLGRFEATLLLTIGLAVVAAALWPIGERAVLKSGASRILAVSAAGLATMWVFLRHPVMLLRREGLAERLMWLLDMEDNARFVGVAREMLAGTPSGGRLASEFGTGFMSSAVLLNGAFRGLPTGDPRAAAIDVTNLSVALAVAIVALIVITVSITAMASSLGRSGPVRAIADVPVVSVVVATALWVSVGVPMRSGFLSFVWGVVWVALAASLSPLTRYTSGWRKAVLLVALASTIILMVDSWPYLIAGLIPIMTLAVPSKHDKAAVRTRTRQAMRLGLVSIALLIGAVLLWNSPLRSVLESAGSAVLEVEGTSITTDPWMRLVATAAVILGLLAAHEAARASGRAPLHEVMSSPSAAAAALGMSVLGLQLLAIAVNEGATGYAGRKLLHGAVAVALIVALPTVLERIVASRLPVTAVAGAVGLVMMTSTPVAGFHSAWSAHVNTHLQPHALAISDAIQVTSSELPIRCLPPERTAATASARWAAYFCVNWVEDAFNEDRFHGYRMDMLVHEGDDFDELTDRMLAERLSDYLFSYRITAGPGWAHWDGIS